MIKIIIDTRGTFAHSSLSLVASIPRAERHMPKATLLSFAFYAVCSKMRGETPNLRYYYVCCARMTLCLYFGVIKWRVACERVSKRGRESEGVEGAHGGPSALINSPYKPTPAIDVDDETIPPSSFPPRKRTGVAWLTNHTRQVSSRKAGLALRSPATARRRRRLCIYILHRVINSTKSITLAT